MELFFEQSGDKEAQTIVFIHGGGMDSSVWMNNINFFNDFNCIAIDLPEHGNSADIKPFSINGSVRLIADIIRNNSCEGKAHIVGHSLGGVVSIYLISMYPELIDHAVIASGNLRPSALYQIFTNSLVCKAISIINRKLLKKEYITAEMLKRVYQEMILNSKIPKELYGTNIPALFIAGQNEPAFLKKSNRDLGGILVNSECVTILKANHNYPWVDYSLFNELVKEWFNNRFTDNERVCYC